VFTNPALITINDASFATPYPSVINVPVLGGNITSLRVTLNGINHTFPDDIDILLVGPTGARTLLMSDVGGGSSINNVNLTFSNTAFLLSLPNSTQITTGTYLPTDFSAGDTFPAPAPVSPYSASFAPFIGTAPNGNWSLYVMDDTGSDIGNIANGWALDFTIVQPLVPTLSTTNIPSGAGRLLLGNNLDNVIVGAASNDTIYGYAGNDVVDAAGGNDYIDGGIGNDLLFGGMGNDTVVGGAGNDTLSGVIRSGVVNPGLGEQDRLIGGADADTFLLGDGISVYYSDNNPATLGLSDFAIISDFSVSLDRIQLTGLPANYSISTTTGGGVTGAGIFLTDGELIGILSGISPASLNLNSSSFAYV